LRPCPTTNKRCKYGLGNDASLVETYYPATTDEEAMWQAATVLGLAGMQEPIRHTARGASLSVPVYRYYYTHVPPTEAGAGLGCFHGSELAYVFGNLDAAEGYGSSDTVFSNQVMDLWTNFAKTGTPYATGLPAWSEFSVGQENAFHLNGPDDFELTEGLSFDEECDLFESDRAQSCSRLSKVVPKAGIYRILRRNLKELHGSGSSF
jgi:carboxylesterase type B